MTGSSRGGLCPLLALWGWRQGAPWARGLRRSPGFSWGDLFHQERLCFHDAIGTMAGREVHADGPLFGPARHGEGEPQSPGGVCAGEGKFRGGLGFPRLEPSV